MSVLAATSLVEGKRGPEVRGQMSAASALDRLLQGSGLTYVFVQSNAVKIVAKDQAEAAPPPTTAPPADEAGDRVIVTGTNIRGAQPASSAVDVYTSADIARTGAVTTEQFVGKLPQNLGTFSQYAPGANTAGTNPDAVTSVDLRGLGVGTTLTLVNGRRISLSNGGRSADVSLIPAAALDRVEVLADGASAIYGSDAIGGVINFILRDDFEGAETRLSYGGVTRGGLRQSDASQTFGSRWDGGHGLASYSFHAASALETSDRSYAAAAGPGNLTPVDTRHHIFVTASQGLADRLTLNADFGQSWRKVKNSYSNLSSPVLANRTFSRYTSQTDQVFASLAAEYEVTDNLVADLSAAYSEIDVDGFLSLVRPNRVPPTTTISNFGTRNSQLDVMGKLDGTLASLPGGDLRFSVGAGVLEEEFKGRSPITSIQSAGSLGRRSTYAFAEVWTPLIGPSQQVPLVRSFALSLAARYTDYQDTSETSVARDFGDSTDPKVGFAWEPVESLRFRGTYGRSFRAPSLTQLDNTGGLHYLTPETVGGQPSILLAVTGYGDANLSSETATSYTLGFDYEPTWDDGLRFSATYYDVDYANRIEVAPTGGLNPFVNPSLLPDLIYRPPSPAFIEDALRATRLLFNTTSINVTDPAAAAAALAARTDVWIYDTRFKNLALSRQQGIDFNASNQFDTAWGDLNLGANVTHILKFEKQGSGAGAVLPATDVPGQPANWRGRFHAGLTNGAFSGTIGLNYVDSYTNRQAPIGQQKIDSWTTVDLALTYDFGRAGSAASKDGTRLSLSIQNLLDADPPLLRTGLGANIILPVGFDPANANPLGTLVVVGLSKAW
ncbi:MAG: TonB-dependent receptor [Hyphomonadaceae bacterium]|nr:TonB-dependent receptor [Hyphomonadaceae bacterium]